MVWSTVQKLQPVEHNAGFTFLWFGTGKKIVISAMRLYDTTQVPTSLGLHNKSERLHCWRSPPGQVTGSQQQKDDDLIKPRRLPNPLLASQQQRALHQELLFCQRRGVLPRRKPELQRVLESKQRQQHKQRELALHPPSDLEVKLRTRLQRIQVYELEEKKRNENLKNVPEFVRVRQTLRCSPNSSK